MIPLLMTLITAPASAAPVTYALDPGQSTLAVTIYYDRDRWTPITAHDHVIQAQTFTGSVTWDTEDASACKVDISFPITTLVVDPAGARKRAGIDPEGTVSDGNKTSILSNMQVKRNLYADSFPTISYKATSCSGTNGAVAVTGSLTIRGLGKSVAVPMAIEATPTSFKANGKFELTHADFGMTPFTIGMGLPKNTEKLSFEVDVTGKL